MKTDNRPIWIIDAETDPFLHGRVPRPFIWGLYTGISFHTFATEQELVDAIKDNDVIVYAHNGGRFDFHYLLSFLNLAEPLTVISGRLVAAKIGKCELRDSWNLFPLALKKFASKIDIDISKLEADVRHLHMKEIIRYLKQDCVGLYDAITAFETDYGRHLTQAGAAMKQWELISELKRPKSDRTFFKQYSKYYYGGRVQCFSKGHVNGPLQIYDINSAYPHAMLEAHPYSPDDIVSTRFPKTIKSTSMLTVRCVSNGALPYRNDHDQIIFPTDNVRRTYYIPGHEYIAAMDTLSLQHVQILHSYDFTNIVSFSPYINHFYEKRIEAIVKGDLAQNVFSKLFMNSLYGKFGANPDNYGNFICVEFDDVTRHKDYTFDGMLGPYALLKAPLEEWQSHFINVATAASITSAVRAKLWRAIFSSKGMAYCDTDSIVCQSSDVALSAKLGDWKHEGEAREGWIAGKKLYYFAMNDGTEKKASKGVKMTGDEIRRVALGEMVMTENDAPTFSLHNPPKFQKRNVKRTI